MQAIQLLSVIMLHDLCVTVCVCSEGSALFHITIQFIAWLSKLPGSSLMRVGNITFLPQGYGVLRNRGHDIFDVSALISGNKSEPIVSPILTNFIYACPELCA